MTRRPLRFPQLAVACPWCYAPAGDLCTSHGGTRPRRADTHQARRDAWVTALAQCPTCQAIPGASCTVIGTRRLLAQAGAHPERDQAAVDHTREPE
ncbi:zinc finger domain-containing protein [Streptomyces sp. NPDC055078]